MFKGPEVAEILNLCSQGGLDDSDLTEDQSKAELLQDRLGERFFVGSLNKGLQDKELSRLCDMSGAGRSEPIGVLLKNEKTDMGWIIMIKEFGKGLSRDSQSAAEHETANVIYYAAIAYGLVFNGSKITKFSYKQLEKSFSVFVSLEWVPSDLKNLFDKGIKFCQQKTRK